MKTILISDKAFSMELFSMGLFDGFIKEQLQPFMKPPMHAHFDLDTIEKCRETFQCSLSEALDITSASDYEEVQLQYSDDGMIRFGDRGELSIVRKIGDIWVPTYDYSDVRTTAKELFEEVDAYYLSKEEINISDTFRLGRRLLFFAKHIPFIRVSNTEVWKFTDRAFYITVYRGGDDYATMINKGENDIKKYLDEYKKKHHSVTFGEF